MIFSEMDEKITIFDQMQDRDGPVVLINKFTVPPEDADELVNAWASDAAWMKKQPGFISTQLHRGISGSGVFLNYAVWESTEDQGRVHKPRIQGRAQPLSVQHQCFSASLSQSRGRWYLHCLRSASIWRTFFRKHKTETCKSPK